MPGIEKVLERRFVKWAKENDIVPIKGPAQTAKGFPDRFFQLPNKGGTIYVEFKGDDTYYGLTKIQMWWQEYLLKSSPNRYFVISTEEEYEHLIKLCTTFMKIGPALTAYETSLLKRIGL